MVSEYVVGVFRCSFRDVPLARVARRATVVSAAGFMFGAVDGLV